MKRNNIYKIIFAGVVIAVLGGYLAMAQVGGRQVLGDRYILTFENIEEPPQTRQVLVSCPPGQASVKEVFGPASWVDYDVFEIEPLGAGQTVRAVVSLVGCYPPRDFSMAIFDPEGEEIFIGSLGDGNISLEPALYSEFRSFLGL